MPNRPFPFKPHAVTSVTVSLEDVLVGLLRLRNIHEGIWTLGVNFTHIGASGMIQGKLCPGALTAVTSVVLERVSTVGPLAVDARVVNPNSRIVVPTGVTLQ